MIIIYKKIKYNVCHNNNGHKTGVQEANEAKKKEKSNETKKKEKNI